MARLPVPGSDNDSLGDLLNEFLRVAHHEDGRVRNLIKTPEDFGPIGVGADDNETLDAFFNEEKVDNANGSIVRAFSPGATYRLSHEIVVAPTTGWNFRFLLYGNHATIRWIGGQNTGSCLRFGNYAEGNSDLYKKAFWSKLMDFQIETSVPEGGGDVGLTMDFADFTVLENVKIAGFSKQIFSQVCKSMTWQNINLAGGEIGAEFGQIVNVFNWLGGKVQQCNKGIVYRGGVFTIQGIDLSYVKMVGCELNKAGAGAVRFYSERIGSVGPNDPPTPNNTAKVLHIIDSSNIEVLGSLNCTNGPASSGTHAAWGAKIENSRNIRIRASGKLPQVAFVEADANCRNVIVDELAFCNDDIGDIGVPTSGPVIPGVSTVRPPILRAPSATYLYDASNEQAPVSLAPSDLASWTFSPTAELLNEIHENFERTGNAQAVRWHESSSTAQVKFQIQNVAAGEVYRFEGRTRLLRFTEPDPAQRGSNMAILRVRGFGTANVGQQVTVRLGEQWQDWYFDYVVPTAEFAVTFFLLPATNWEQYDMLVDFVRIHRIG